MPSNHDQLLFFQPMGRQAALKPGASLMDLARDAGVGIGSICGGKGSCGKCKVRFDGSAPPPGPEEFSLLGRAGQEGIRLACRVQPLSGGVVWVPRESRLQQLVIIDTGHRLETVVDPAVKPLDLTLDTSSSAPPRERLLEALVRELGALHFILPANSNEILSGVADYDQGSISMVLRNDHQVLDLGLRRDLPCLGLAVDLGTTTVAAYLFDLEDGRPLAVKAGINPQIVRGEDLISRIAYAQSRPGGLQALGDMARECISQLTMAACQEAGVSPQRIFDMVLVGNTAMHHIFLGLEPGGLGRPPYAPLLSNAHDTPAHNLGFDLGPGAMLHTLPVRAGFVGSDSVAAALACGADRVNKSTLIADLGTNGELILATPQKMLCCSTAAGVAFEGGHITWGMRAGPGAVEKVALSSQDLRPSLSVIGGGLPLGICGSGLVSLAAELVRRQVITPQGGLRQGMASERLGLGEQGWEYLLAAAGEGGAGQDLAVTQRDLAQLLLAKAAVHAGTALMMAELGIERIDNVLLAGAFGNYLDPKDACDIGLFPGVAPDRVTGVGNAAGAGAIMALLSKSERQRAQDLAQALNFLELTGHPLFNDAYVDGMFWGSGPEPE